MAEVEKVIVYHGSRNVKPILESGVILPGYWLKHGEDAWRAQAEKYMLASNKDDGGNFRHPSGLFVFYQRNGIMLALGLLTVLEL